MLVLGCLLLALCIESVFFNSSYFRDGKVDEPVETLKYENIEKLDNSRYKVIDNNKPAKLMIPINNSKAKTLSFELSHL